MCGLQIRCSCLKGDSVNVEARDEGLVHSPLDRHLRNIANPVLASRCDTGQGRNKTSFSDGNKT